MAGLVLNTGFRLECNGRLAHSFSCTGIEEFLESGDKAIMALPAEK
ncbi:MAG: hypothetical protein HY394_00215 [Candidatus Diapherotrites archaeon]|nr:hypothetical protein [Candidatus Diapherotrites archaeon]